MEVSVCDWCEGAGCDECQPTAEASAKAAAAAAAWEAAEAAAAAAEADELNDEEKPAVPALDEKQFVFGEAAFEPLPKRPPPRQFKDLSDAHLVTMLTESVPGVKNIRGERNSKCATEMLSYAYRNGLFMLPQIGPLIIPALKFIFGSLNELNARDPKRVSVLTTLARACEDCQMVQAREILRCYGDLTNQNQTLDVQVKYFMMRQKEAALDKFITSMHGKDCDLDHTKVRPGQQRAHLKSAYIDIFGHALGLEGVEAAKEDRFLADASKELRKADGVWAGSSDNVVLLLIRRSIDAELPMFVNYLLADINNQSATADRAISRDVIFHWFKENENIKVADQRAAALVTKHGVDANDVFYDEERAADYANQEPSQPSKGNEYQPFLSRKVLLLMLLKMGIIVPNQRS